METGTRQIVTGLLKQIQSIRDLPKAVIALWQFGLSDDQREFAKQALKAYALANLIGGLKRRNDEQEVDKILNASYGNKKTL